MHSKKTIMERFIQQLSKYYPSIINGSLTFTIHFRNGKPQKVESEAKESFGS